MSFRNAPLMGVQMGLFSTLAWSSMSTLAGLPNSLRRQMSPTQRPYPYCAIVRDLTVETVVDDINNVVGGRREGSESAFVLLDKVLFCSRKSRDAVQFTDGLVRSVGNNLSGNRGVKSGHLQVDTDIGVVDINDVRTTQVSNCIEIADSIGGGSEGGNSSQSSGLAQELTAFSSELSGGPLSLVVGGKGGDSAVDEKTNM